ncbi:polycystic kidney disease protein 1-like 2 [Lates japonicus]|uniref:Polycystic kidney disease protein 1-like 2 n=1 Tax=Lates japonicus TaxID=270547 RepID=A0AAD3MZX5_LATJO|nr:polycystic kidney disease protein 1-like 2 [Lates japonicus]
MENFNLLLSQVYMLYFFVDLTPRIAIGHEIDLASAFRLVLHEILWAAFNFFQVPEYITKSVKAYFQDLQFCIATQEIGIKAGYTISPLAFTMETGLDQTGRVSAQVRKWLGLRRCLSSMGLNGNGALSLSISGLVEEYKCAKARLDMTIKEPHDPCIRNIAPTLATGRKWDPVSAVSDVKAALRHQEFVGAVVVCWGLESMSMAEGDLAWEQQHPHGKNQHQMNTVWVA